jgi:hypothetical protein
MGSAPAPESEPTGPGRLGGLAAAARATPWPARAAAALLAAEALVLLGLGGLLVARGFGADIENQGRAELGGIMALVAGLFVALLARGLLTQRHASRSPTVVVQLLCLPVAWGLLQGGMYGYGVPLVVVPVSILVLLGLAGAYR